MSRIRCSENKSTELRLIDSFKSAKITGWRRGSKLPGKPDFVFIQIKKAIFADGCFWHGCPRHGLEGRKNRTPSARVDFWFTKIAKNKSRDRKVNRLLRAKGWTVLRIWEHELTRKNEPKLILKLRKSIPENSAK